MTNEQFLVWLQDPAAVRMVLVEALVHVAGVEVTRYLASRPFLTGPADVPANTLYEPLIVGGIGLSEQVSLTAEASLSSGDIELSNVDGELDGWLGEVWVNRTIRAWVGDPSWPRGQFQPIFNGVIADIDSASRDSVNIKLRDKLQRLNTPLTEQLLGGVTANKGALLPLLFGEGHNLAPLLTDPALQEYQFHAGQVEPGAEVRTNGKPREVDFYPERGAFRFRDAVGTGAVTVSAHGDSAGGYAAALAAHATVVQQDAEAMATFDAALEVERQKVDRIAIAGRVPVNVLGARPGDYIVPVQDGEGIAGIAVHADDITMAQYLRAVGRVISIEPDGRAYVMVKAV